MSHSILERVVAVTKPTKPEIGQLQQPRDLGGPVLRKALPPASVTISEVAARDIAERAGGMSQNVLVKKFRDMLG